MQPKVIFSLNTHPITNNRWYMGNRLNDTIYMAGLSILYACKWYSAVEVYVDKIAYDFLKYLPCKIILTKFDNNPKLWMKSKIDIIKLQNEPFIHIDNDVFLKQKIDLSFDTILVERNDVAYQNYDSLVVFFSKYSKELKYWLQKPNLIPSCGVLGFAEKKLQNNFVEAFNQFERVFNKYQKEYNSYLKKCGEIGEYLEPCLVLEQYNLGCMLEKENIKYKLLLEGGTEAEQSKNATRLGYSHLHGSAKYDPKVVKRIHYLFETTFPEHYIQISKKIKLGYNQIQEQLG